ncbi:MAG: SMC family ATPase [Saprospiraceae bacterium]|nr:SMC family ATPase [Saprospiraceae bacterium]
MILNTLHLENFKQYGQLDLEFREGLVGVVGRNGAGKSTLFDAILFCLFGQGLEKEMVRSSFAEPKATVALHLGFTLGLERFLVKREFRGKILTAGAELFKNDELIAKGVLPVNEEIARLLNMERDGFRRSVFSGQKELAELSEASGAERQRMVRKMLGLDNLDDIKKRINDDTRALRQQISGQAQLLLSEETVRALEEEIEQRLAESHSLAEQSSREQKALDEVAVRQRQAHQEFDTQEQLYRRFNELRREIDRGQERQANLQQQKRELAQRQSDLLATQNELESRREQFAGRLRNKSQLAAMDEDRQRKTNFEVNTGNLALIQEQLDALNRQNPVPSDAASRLQSLENSLAEQEQILKETTARIESQLEQFRRIEREISTLHERIRDREAKVNNLKAIGKDGACPTCFQPVRDAYESVIQQLDTEIADIQQVQLGALEKEKELAKQTGLSLREQESDARSRLEQSKQAKNLLEEQIRRQKQLAEQKQHLEAQATRYRQVLQQIGDVNFNEAEYQSLKQRVDAQETAYLEFAKTEAYLARELPLLLKAQEQNEINVQAELAGFQEKTSRLEAIGFNAEAYEAAKTRLAGFDEAYARQSAIAAEIVRKRQEIDNDIERKREKLQNDARIRRLIGDKQAETELLDKLALSLDGFRNEILEKVSPSISREASALFSRITRGKYENILVDENFDFKIADGGEYYPIRRFSGGEIDLANFCLRIAITKAIVELSGSGQGIEFLAFDEIFGSQDEERRMEIMLALNFLQEQFRQIYIVSHNESLRDYFPNILEVRSLQEGGSTASWV